jgi:hypothetical protein
LGVNWLSVTPKAGALTASKGAFSEYYLNYNRKVLLREKYNVAVIVGTSFLNSHGLSAKAYYLGTAITFDINPEEAGFYGCYGLSASYQFSKNNYLTAQFVRNIHNVVEFGFYFDRLQVQFEHRF